MASMPPDLFSERSGFSSPQRVLELAHVYRLRASVSKPDGSNRPPEDQAYWSIVERMLDGFYRVTVDGQIVRCSPKAVQMLGYSSEDELIGKVSMADLWVFPNERDLLLAELREHGTVRGFEASLKRKDGSRVRIEMTVAAWLGADGELLGTDGVVRDVTESSRSEQQFRSLIRNSPGAIFRYVGGDRRRYTFMSESIEEITDYPTEYFTGNTNPLVDIIHPEEKETAEALSTVNVKSGEHYSYEMRILTPDNETRWIQLRGSGATDRITDMEVVDGVILDVTEAHRIADELAESERQVQTLIRNVPGAIYRFAEQEDGTWHFSYMSPAIEAMTGYPAEFFVGEEDPFEKILRTDDRERVGELITNALATKGNFNFEHRVSHKDGSVRWLRVQGSMAADPVTGLHHVDGVQLDVSDLHEATAAVERSEAMFRHLFDSMAEGYWVTGADSRVQLCNAAALQIFGYPDETSLVGIDSLALMVNDEQRKSFLKELMANRVADGREIDVRHNDGGIITLNFSTRLVGEGEELRTETTFRDVTEQKQIDAEIRAARHSAEQANRAKSTFLANMSHELRTPLNAIIGYSEMMMEEAEELEEDVFSEDLEKVHNAGTHLLALINDVLDLSKVEAGRSELFIENFTVDELMNSVTSTIEPLIAVKGNQFELDVESGKTVLQQDLTKLRQSLLNLLSNAAKFTDHGTVTLAAQLQADNGECWLELAVTDTGIGIAPDKHEKLFDEFSQADASTTREYGGTGLGLAISQRFCKIMGGDIAVRSSPGEGSTFTIRVPATLPEAESSPITEARLGADTPPLPKDPSRTVLVIDDDVEACEIIANHLTRSGFEVVTALGGAEGLRLAKEIHPCAITLDVMMPEIDGWSVLAALQADADFEDVPVVMVSMIDDKSTGYTLGATSYLTKPVDRDELLAAIGKTSEAGANVLVIEDDEDTRGMLFRVLNRAGFKVTEAANGEEGLAELQHSCPDIILLDLMMPVMDGFDFLLQMRGREDMGEIPVVVVTAKDLTDEEHDFLSGRVENVLQKGAYTRDQLLGLVRMALAELG